MLHAHAVPLGFDHNVLLGVVLPEPADDARTNGDLGTSLNLADEASMTTPSKGPPLSTNVEPISSNRIAIAASVC